MSKIYTITNSVPSILQLDINNALIYSFTYSQPQTIANHEHLVTLRRKKEIEGYELYSPVRIPHITSI